MPAIDSPKTFTSKTMTLQNAPIFPAFDAVLSAGNVPAASSSSSSPAFLQCSISASESELPPKRKKKRERERFNSYRRRGDERGNSLCLAQEIINLKAKYPIKQFQRILEQAARAVRAEGKRTTAHKQLDILVAVKHGAHEAEEICAEAGLNLRQEGNDLLAGLCEDGKIICVKESRSVNGRGRKRHLYYLPSQINKAVRHLEK